MEEKLMELCEVAKRSAEAAVKMGGDGEEARCIDALNQLSKLSLTGQIIFSTQMILQVARHVQPLKNHPKMKIRDMATDFIWVWAIIFDKHMKRHGKYLGSYTDSVKIEPTNMETGKIKKVDKQTSDKFKKILNAENVEVQKVDEMGKTNLVENVKVEELICEDQGQASGTNPQKLSYLLKCNDSFREIVREKLYTALSKVSGEANEDIRDEVNKCDPIRVAILVESAMFEKWGRSNGTYKVKYRCLLCNINDPDNPDFRRKVRLGHVKPETVINMTAEEMFSDVMRLMYRQHVSEKALYYEIDRTLFPREPETSSRHIIKCSQCGVQKTTYMAVFRRSLTFTACANCDKGEDLFSGSDQVRDLFSKLMRRKNKWQTELKYC